MSDPFSDGINEAIREAMRSVRDAMGDEGLFGDSDADTDPGQSLDRVFQVGPGAELSLTNVSGRIQVRGADVDTITVRATKRGSPSRAANTAINFDQEANRVSVGARGTLGSGLLIGRNVGRVDYDAVVPRSCSLRIHTVSAEMVVRDLTGPVVIESVSGDARLRALGSDLTASTVSGDLSVEDMQGSLVLRTTSGDIEVSRSRIRRFNLNSVSGDFTIETPLAAGEHYFAKTVSGDLHLRVPPSSGATVQLKTTSGDVDIRLPAEVIKSGRRHWQGRINGGGASIEMTSVSGDLTIAPGGWDAAWQEPDPSATRVPSVSDVPDGAEVPDVPDISTPPSAPPLSSQVEAAEPEDTGSILRLLEQGQITVDEAMRRLDNLNQP